MYSETTEGIRVQVEVRYAPEHSSPPQGQWFFVYQIEITNESPLAARLVRRRWVITDAEGREQVVEGPGVVGQTPRLEPGEVHRYTSGCPLTTPFGTMKGHYTMVRDSGAPFQVVVPEFALTQPHGLN